MTSAAVELLVRGEARFTTDLPLPGGGLHAMVAVSPHAHASFDAVDCAAARAYPGVVAVLAAPDIPGVNQIGAIAHDEPLLAEGEVHCVGQPIALVLAESAEAAWRAAQLVTAQWRVLPAVLDAQDAFRSGHLIAPPRTFACGDVDSAWAGCATVVSGRVELGAQEHAYLETQGALAVPRDDGGVLVHAGTQSPSATQRAIAAVTGLPMNLVEVEVARLGGGFGGKEEQGSPWAALAALGAIESGRPVRIQLDRRDDMRITGKRHPYSATYRLGLDADGRFLAYETTLLQDAGCTTDLSLAVLERSLFHACNAYWIPNVRIVVASCRTNHPSNTAFRGFGAPQSMAVIEAAIRAAAHELGVPAMQLQAANLLSEGDVTHFGMPLVDVRARRCWDELVARHDPAGLIAEAAAFNATHPLIRRGVDVVPLAFGIAFTARLLNQAEALVHVYADGTVSVTTGAVEMGQGVHAKVQSAVAHELGIDRGLVHVEPTTTSRVANVSPTAASTGADLNGAAAVQACRVIRAGLDKVDPEGQLGWVDRVAQAYSDRVGLSALAHYATPALAFDPGVPGTRPFAYHVYGAAVVTSTVDVLRGTASVDRVAIVHDVGMSIDRLIDIGQVEGAVVQGVGWLTTEEIRHDPEGRLLTDSLATYKIPDLDSAPELDVTLLEQASPGLLGSKAVGEPPLVYGLGALFSIRDAIRSVRPDLTDDVTAPHDVRAGVRAAARAVGGGAGTAGAGAGARHGGRSGAVARPWAHPCLRSTSGASSPTSSSRGPCAPWWPWRRVGAARRGGEGRSWRSGRTDPWPEPSVAGSPSPRSSTGWLPSCAPVLDVRATGVRATGVRVRVWPSSSRSSTARGRRVPPGSSAVGRRWWSSAPWPRVTCRACAGCSRHSLRAGPRSGPPTPAAGGWSWRAWGRAWGWSGRVGTGATTIEAVPLTASR